jgi:gamma-glutamyltranspeptidase/glutathione hydrolase
VRDSPNGHGITALLALNILENFDLHAMGHNSPQYLHTLIEALRLSFADTTFHVCDPSAHPVPVEGLLRKEYTKARAALVDVAAANKDPQRGSPASSPDNCLLLRG